MVSSLLGGMAVTIEPYFICQARRSDVTLCSRHFWFASPYHADELARLMKSESSFVHIGDPRVCPIIVALED